MSKQTIVDLAAVLTTLAECGGKAIASMAYLALGSDMTRYNRVRALLTETGTATVTNETITLTPRGRELAAKLEKALGSL